MSMGGSGEIKVVCLVVIALVAAAARPGGAAISCGQVLSSLSPCLAYLQRGGAVAASCCDGVKSLNSAAATTPDRQDVCGCVKSLAPGVGAKADFINALPAKCGVSVPYVYSPSLDCSKVQ